MPVSHRPRNHRARMRARQNWIDAGRPSPKATESLKDSPPKIMLSPLPKTWVGRVSDHIGRFFREKK